MELGPGLGVGVVAEAEVGARARGRVGGRGRERGREQEVTRRRGLGGAPRAVLETRGRGGHVLSASVHPRGTSANAINNIRLRIRSYEV